MPMADDPFQILQLQFRENTRARLRQMGGLLDMLDREPAKLAPFEALGSHFHGLSGLGSTYGYPSITRLAAIGEEETLELLRAGGKPSGEQLAHWRSLTEEIRRELEAAPALTSPLPPQRPAAAAFDVLVLEDDPDLQALLENLLRGEGFSVRLSNSCHQAIEAMQQRLPDAMICDVKLPDGTGYDAVRTLRALPGGESVLALIVTVLDDFLDRVEAIRCGADGFFEKPVDSASLMRRVALACQSKIGPSARILVVEDEPDQAGLLTSILEAVGYEFEVCAEADRVQEVVTEFRPDLVLMDIHLSTGVNGHELARLIRQDELHATTPVVFVTTEGEIEAVLGTIRAGGDDHLIKPVDPRLLLTVVDSRLQKARLLRSLVDRDGLTGLFTHSVFHQLLSRAARQERRAHPEQSVLVMIDLDHFKSVNDRHGHRAGDRVLSALGSFLRRRVRHSDAMARYGGEEFALLLHHLSQDEAHRLVSGLLEEFSTLEHFAGTERFRVTFSAGIAAFDPERDGGVESWIEAADRALYAAKRAGRARVMDAEA